MCFSALQAVLWSSSPSSSLCQKGWQLPPLPHFLRFARHTKTTSSFRSRALAASDPSHEVAYTSWMCESDGLCSKTGNKICRSQNPQRKLKMIYLQCNSLNFVVYVTTAFNSLTSKVTERGTSTGHNTNTRTKPHLLRAYCEAQISYFLTWWQGVGSL